MIELIPIEEIQERIFMIRGHRVMMDSDLAIIYGVITKRLNEQVKRNLKRFPLDFMFQINEEEYESLRSQFATLKQSRGKHRKQRSGKLGVIGIISNRRIFIIGNS